MLSRTDLRGGIGTLSIGGCLFAPALIRYSCYVALLFWGISEMAGWVTRGGNQDNYIQEASWNCGMACVAMALNRQGHGNPTTRAIAAVSQAQGGSSYVSANIDRPGVSDTTHNSSLLIQALALRRRAIEPTDNPLGQQNPQQMLERLHEGSNPGTGGRNLAKTLKDGYNILTTGYVGAVHTGLLKTAMQNATMAKPLILGLEDPPHFVLCEGLVAGTGNRYSVVDPADGVRYFDGRLRNGTKIKFNGTSYYTKIDEYIYT